MILLILTEANMTASNTTKPKSLQIFLPEAEKRRIKILAARQGLTLRAAVRQAFQAWEAQLRSGTPGRQPVARGAETADGGKAVRAIQSKPQQPARSGRRAQADNVPAATAGGDQVPQRPEPPRHWLGRAAQLDWSKCPLVEVAPAQDGDIWVLRGTDVPLASVLIAVDEGHPLLEITAAYKISMRFLLAVLQVVATPAPSASAT